MPFGIIGRMGPGMRHVVGFGDWSTGRGTFKGEFGVRHCNQRGLTFAGMRPSSQITLGRLVIKLNTENYDTVNTRCKTNCNCDHLEISICRNN